MSLTLRDASSEVGPHRGHARARAGSSSSFGSPYDLQVFCNYSQQNPTSDQAAKFDQQDDADTKFIRTLPDVPDSDIHASRLCNSLSFWGRRMADGCGEECGAGVGPTRP